jgi:hypothetical protein
MEASADEGIVALGKVESPAPHHTTVSGGIIAPAASDDGKGIGGMVAPPTHNDAAMSRRFAQVTVSNERSLTLGQIVLSTTDSGVLSQRSIVKSSAHEGVTVGLVTMAARNAR